MLKSGDKIISAHAETCSGPGWANSIVIVVVRSQDGKYREECLQPDQQPPRMQHLFNASEAVHRGMTLAAMEAFTKMSKESDLSESDLYREKV